MPTIADYNQFEGTHWETGSIRNFMAARGFTAPHTGKPYSEAFLLGISGGITVGYFNFAYEGVDPQCNILTRNTFDPLDKLLSRLGVVQTVQQTRKPERAAAILADVLADGIPAIVWPDMWSLPYNGLEHDAGMWGAFPIIVYGYEPERDVVNIADRARVPLTVTTAELENARSRIKKDRYRLLTLDAPHPDKLAAAVRSGICDTIQLMTEKPPKGSPNNFGLKALRFWALNLIRPNQRLSWEKRFPVGIPMFAGLTSAYEFAFLFGKDVRQDAERNQYAAFLDEAAHLLDKPALHDAAGLYHAGAAEWAALPALLLADDVAPFAATRELMLRRHRLFLEQGGASLAERMTITARLAAIRAEMAHNFPLSHAAVVTYRERLAVQIERIHDAEAAAVHALQAAMQ